MKHRALFRLLPDDTLELWVGPEVFHGWEQADWDIYCASYGNMRKLANFYGVGVEYDDGKD